MSSPFSDNKAAKRFEYVQDGATAFANYRRDSGTLYIDYVEAPSQLRGSGAAGKLMQHVMEKARGESVKVVPVCGYAAAWVSRHPEFDDLRA